MLENLEKDKTSEGAERNKKRRNEDEAGCNDHTRHFELEKFGADPFRPIAEPGTEIEEVEFYAGCLKKMVQIERDMEPERRQRTCRV